MDLKMVKEEVLHCSLTLKRVFIAESSPQLSGFISFSFSFNETKLTFDRKRGTVETKYCSLEKISCIIQVISDAEHSVGIVYRS